MLTIAPWNYPILTTINSVAPAILSGNSVIIKHSARTLLCADHFVDAFLEAGAPEGLVTALHTGHDEVAQVIRHPSIGFVSFTGSVPGGGAVYRAVASERFIDATLELGEKILAMSPRTRIWTLPSTRLSTAPFSTTAESCCGIERVYVHDPARRVFEQAQTVLAGYRLGNPADASTTHGSLRLANARSSAVTRRCQSSRSAALDGWVMTDAAGKGRFFNPHCSPSADHTMDIMTEESFGPVLGVAPVRSDEEAIALTNDRNIGLTASISRDLSKSARRKCHASKPANTVYEPVRLSGPSPCGRGSRTTRRQFTVSSTAFQGFNKFFKRLPF